MKKIIRTAFAVFAAAAAVSAGAAAVCAEDVTLDIEAETSNGSWGQSVKYLTSRNEDISDAFDPCTMTADSVVKVSYECDAGDEENHIELIWQSWGDHVTDIAADWNKVAPSSYEEGYSEFTFDDIAASCGTEDFSEVYAICVGDMGTPVTVTEIIITNVSAEGAAAESEEETETEEVTEAETEEETEAETEEVTESETEQETEAEAEEETETEEVTEAAEETEATEESEITSETEESGIEAGGVVLIVAIVLAAAAIVVILLLMKRNGPAKDNDDWKR